MAKVNRNAKPGNIMRRDSDGAFILLVVGLTFDLMDESIADRKRTMLVAMATGTGKTFLSVN